MTELLEQVPFNLISVGLLGALALRRLVRMDTHHGLRVVLLTVSLWALAIYLLALAFPPSHTCMPLAEEPGAFTISG